MLKFSVFILVALLALGFILYQILDFFFDINNPVSRIRKDEKYAHIELDAISSDLVLFESQEIELLSQAITSKTRRKAKHNETIGYFQSIYHEKLFSYFKFAYDDSRIFILVKYNAGSIKIIFEKSKWLVTFDDKSTYILTKDHLILDQSNQEVGYINMNPGEDFGAIFFNSNEIATFNIKEGKTELFDRMFLNVKTKDASVDRLLISLSTIYTLNNITI